MAKTFANTHARARALPSYLGLIPLIYFRHHFKNKWDLGVPKLNTWLLRILLTGAFSGSPDGLIDQCTRRIAETQAFDIVSITNLIINAGRSARALT